LTCFGSDEILAPRTAKWVTALHIAGFAVAANEDFLGTEAAESATDFSRAAPDQLSIMRDILGATGAAVRGENPGDEILFFCDP